MRARETICGLLLLQTSVLILACSDGRERGATDVDIECATLGRSSSGLCDDDDDDDDSRKCGQPGSSTACVPPRDAATSCGDVQRQAFAVLNASQHCQQDSDCVVESVAARCLTAFTCSVSVAREQLQSVRQQALELSLAHQRCSSAGSFACPTATCASSPADEARCDPSAKRCMTRTASSDGAVMHEDAGGSDAGDAGFAQDGSMNGGMDATVPLDAAAEAGF